MPASQAWRLEFEIPHMRFDAGTTFNVAGHQLSLAPVDASKSKGYLRFTLDSDVVDAQKAKRLGIGWLQRNLIDTYMVVYGRDLRPRFSDPVLLNRSELGPSLRTINDRIDFTVHLLGLITFGDVEKSLSVARRLRQDANGKALQRSLRWFRKASDSTEAVDEFVTLWVAFNAFYGTFDPNRRGDKTAIGNLINAYPSTDKIREILTADDVAVAALVSRGLTDWRRRANYSEQLNVSLGGQDARTTLRKVCICLLSVRNEIFHGGVKPTKDTAFLRKCAGLLRRIYRECYCAYLGLT